MISVLINSKNPCPVCGSKSFIPYYEDPATQEIRYESKSDCIIPLIDIPISDLVNFRYLYLDECINCNTVLNNVPKV